MDYRELKKEQQVNILRGRLARLEEHHYGVMLDLKDAESVSDKPTIENALIKRGVVEQQIENCVAALGELAPRKGKKRNAKAS